MSGLAQNVIIYESPVGNNLDARSCFAKMSTHLFIRDPVGCTTKSGSAKTCLVGKFYLNTTC